MSTDETDRFVRALTSDDRRAIALLDPQGSARAQNDPSEEPPHGLLYCLRAWDYLIGCMEDHWRDQHYMVYEYLNILTVRGEIEVFLDAMPADLRVKVERRVERLDTRYRAVTREDGGAELSRYWRPLSDGREVRWWWTRRPIDLPQGW